MQGSYSGTESTGGGVVQGDDGSEEGGIPDMATMQDMMAQMGMGEGMPERGCGRG